MPLTFTIYNGDLLCLEEGHHLIFLQDSPPEIPKIYQEFELATDTPKGASKP